MLISFAIFLLVVNIVLQPNAINSNNDELDFDQAELSQRFRNILSDFGIEDKLIKETSSIDKKNNNDLLNFKIQVPKDLTIPEILQDIYLSFRKDSLTINSIEKVKNGKSVLTLHSGSSTLLQAEFEYSKNYSRNLGSIVFIIYDADPSNQSTATLIESPTRLNFLIRPDSKVIQHLDFIRNNSQQFSVLIDDDIKEQKYQLGPGFSEQRIIAVIKTLVTDFQNAVCFIVDSDSKFYKSSNYEILKRELSKRNIKLFSTYEFEFLTNEESISIIFNEKLNSLNRGESLIFLISEEAYLVLNPEILMHQKKGFRVITSSLVL